MNYKYFLAYDRYLDVHQYCYLLQEIEIGLDKERGRLSQLGINSERIQVRTIVGAIVS